MDFRKILRGGFMENLNSKNIIEMLTKGGISAVLLIIILYFGGTFLSTMQ